MCCKQLEQILNLCSRKQSLTTRNGSVEDWATTIYHCLGIVADKELVAPGPRPIEIVDGGHVVKDLIA